MENYNKMRSEFSISVFQNIRRLPIVYLHHKPDFYFETSTEEKIHARFAQYLI